jgi:hypothetical protein
MSAPWPSTNGLDATLVTCGLVGLLYLAIVFRRARQQSGYQPVFEDTVIFVVVDRRNATDK